MNFSKIGSNTWNITDDGGKISTIEAFKRDIRDPNIDKSEDEILNATRSKSARQFAGDKKSFIPLNHHLSMPALQPPPSSPSGRQQGPERKLANKRIPISSTRKPPPGVSYSIQERPPNRVEVARLESELEDRLRSVLHSEATDLEAVQTGNMYQPHRDEMMIIRDSIHKEFNILNSDVSKEPWIDKLIQCESLRSTCDDVASKLTDMLSVNSSELGNVLRKLRMTYKQTFEQMRKSWRSLREIYLENEKELTKGRQSISSLQDDLRAKDRQIRNQIDKEIADITRQYDSERMCDKELIAQTEFKMDQMSETLRSLNGIFKTMQTDSSSLRGFDLSSKCQRLEKENAALSAECMTLDKLKAELNETKKSLAAAEKDLKSKDNNVAALKLQLTRRDEAISTLMEKEVLRNAEIEKLKILVTHKDKEAEALDLKEAATSVLCIKCKKSLDDLSNIREAVFGASHGDPLAKLHCEALRILLPNLKGRQPNRNSNWLRLCMRSIMFCKLKEDVNILSIKGEMTRFPQFVFAWFERQTEGLSGSSLTKALVLADEDRWGMYYGVKALSRENDAEGLIFWSLLDEYFGEDGLQFVCHCISIVMSMGGSALWDQFGDCISQCSSVNVRNMTEEKERQSKRFIWLDVQTAKAAAKAILVRALETHVRETLEAIDAFMVIPEREEIHRTEKDQSNELDEEDEPTSLVALAKQKSTGATIGKTEATHIDLFLWLRLMLQQLHAEQIQRAAAIRLMFETASVGALTPHIPLGVVDKENPGAHVEFPQFQSICRALFIGMSTSDIASLYYHCYNEGKQKVTSEIFMRVVDRRGLYSRYMKLASPPLLVIKSPQEMFFSNSVNILNASSIDLVPSVDTVRRKVMESDVRKFRMNLGALIHLKMAGMGPELQSLLRNIPDRWRGLLTEAIESVQFALKESYSVKLKKRAKEASTAAVAGDELLEVEDKEHTLPFIDGMQPYVQYRRLLSLALLVKSLTDNPLLPSDIFLDKNSQYLSKFEVSLNQASHVLTTLEDALMLGSVDKKIARCKLRQYDAVRILLITRRLQICVRALFKSDSLMVPRAVRMCMRPGYVRGSNAIKRREVFNDPWWVQTIIAEVYSFKLTFDTKAAVRGLPAISLPQAVLSTLYSKCGSIEIAERLTHDVFLNAKAYCIGVPRIRLFCVFLNVFNEDLDELVAAMLRSTYALSSFMSLLYELHQQIFIDAHKAATEAALINSLMEKFNEKATTDEAHESSSEVSAPGEEMPTAEPTTSDPTNNTANPFSLRIPSSYSHEIKYLFPSSESPFGRTDRRDVWYMDLPSIIQAVKRWSDYQKGIHSHVDIYIQALDKMKAHPHGKGADVDEVIWILMTQWSKVMIWYSKRCVAKAEAADKLSRDDSPVLQGDRNTGKKVSSQMYLNNLVDSVYRVGEAANIVNPKFYPNIYLNKVVKLSLRRNPQYFSSSSGSLSSLSLMEAFMQECMMWDMTGGVAKDTYVAGKQIPLERHDGKKEVSALVNFHPNENNASNVIVYSMESFASTSTHVQHATSPLLALALVHKIFSSHQEVISIAIIQAERSGSKDLEKASVRAKEAVKTLETILKTVDFNSYLLSNRGQPIFDDDAVQAQHNLTLLLLLVDDILISSASSRSNSISNPSVNNSYPRDNWRTGRRVHMERSPAYSVQIKNSLS